MASPVISTTGTHYVGTASPAAIPVPTGVANGSKIVVHVSFGWPTTTAPTAALITPPSGFGAAKYGQAFTDSTDGAVNFQAWFEKTATAADTGTYSFTAAADNGQAADLAAGVAMIVTGGADPVLGDTLHISATTEATSSAAFATFTPPPNCTLVAGIASWGKLGTTTVPTGWTKNGTGVSGSSYGGVFTAYEAIGASPTATGALTFNTASGDLAWGSIATLLSPGTDASVTAATGTATPTAPAPGISVGTNVEADPPPAVDVATAPAPTISATASPTVTPPAATTDATAPAPTVSATGPTIPTLSGETSRTTGTTGGGTAYTKIVGSLSNATSGSSDGYVGYFPTAITSNIKLLIWNHPYESPYDADIAGTGDSGWTFALTSWLLDNGIAIVSSNDAGDDFGSAKVMTAIDNLYGAVNTAMGVTKLIVYGESMGGSAALNWTARHNTAPLVGCMVISGVCDTSLFSSYYSDYNAAYNPMLTAASSWAGLPIYMESSPSDTTVDETSNAHAFQTHVSGQAVMTAVEGTGGHLTSGNYPVSGMESWITSVMSAANATVTPPTAAETATAPAPTITAASDATVTPPAATATSTTPAPTIEADARVTPPTATDPATAPAPTITAVSPNATITPPAATGTASAPAPIVTSFTPGAGSLTVDGQTIPTVSVDDQPVTALYLDDVQIWP